MSQLAFDLDIDQTDTAFLVEQTTDNGGRCSACNHTLKGRYGRVHGGRNHLGWFAWCDDCTEAKRAA